MNRKTRSLTAVIIAVMLIIITASGLLFAACQDKNNNGTGDYTVTYVANYAGGRDIRRVYAYGSKASELEMFRTGYNLDGWYTDKQTSDGNKFDFSTEITKNINLFAKWTAVSTDLCNVTFDYNYSQSPDAIVHTVYKGETISDGKIPKIQRLGFELSGWYTDAACTVEFDKSTKIENDITLYAKYNNVTGLNKNPQTGLAELNNVKIKLWVESDDYGLMTAANAVAEKFNAEYEGKINVEVTTDSSSASGLSLKFRPIEAVALNSGDYYNIYDALTIAGLTFDDNQYYSGQIDDCYKEGMLIGYPVGSIVPGIIYNKALALKYNDNVLPTTAAELIAISDKAVKAETNIFGAGIANDFTGYEISVNNAFVQNGADYWKHTQAGLKNEWADDISKPLAAVNSLRDLFGASFNKGSLNDVKEGKGVMWLSGRAGIDMGTDTRLGMVPVSGLFGSGENSDKIFVKNYVIGISVSGNKYKDGIPDDNGTPNMGAIAASAVFGKYLAENIDLSEADGIYPAYKPLQASVLEKDTANVKNILVNAGSPENFVCYPFCRNSNLIIKGQNGNNVYNGDILLNPSKDETILKRQKTFFVNIFNIDLTEAELKELITKHGKFISAMVSA